MKLQLFSIRGLKRLLLTTAGLGALAFVGAPSAKANGAYDCQRKVERAEWKLEEAIERHGYYSRQANHERHELREEQESCRRQERRWREHEWRERQNYERDRRYNDERDRRYYDDDDRYRDRD